MHKQAALNTFLIVSALTLTAAGFVGMLFIAPMFTMVMLGLIGVGFLIKAIYNLEVVKAEAMERL